MILAWSLFIAYMVGTAWLGWRGFKRTRDFGSFAIGQGDMSPWVVGITLAAATASASTFIINPGFIYVDGLSAWLHIVPATCLGFCTMLTLLSFRFRRIGEKAGALTIPHWIGQRYGSKAFAFYFSIINLLAFAFVVLLVGGISIVMQQLLGVSNTVALLITLIFVTGYVFVGGTYAHVYTNMLQGALMVLVTIIILGSGLHLFFQDSAGFWERIAAQDVNLTAWVNHEGKLFNSVFSIYAAGFLVGATVVCQPHILTKALYVKNDQAVRSYLIIFSAVFVLFLLLGTVGFYARLVVPPEQLIDPVTSAFRQDLVMTVYLKNAFPDWVFTVIGVVLLAAAMSTLDGLLVGLSTITANDMLLYLIDRFGRGRRSEKDRMALAYKLGHVMLIVIAAAAFWVCLNPPKLLGVFGQVGVYGMALAAAPPLLAGVMFKRAPLSLVWSTSILGMAVHFLLYFFGQDFFPNAPFTFANPGVDLSLGVIVALPVVTVGGWLAGGRTGHGA